MKICSKCKIEKEGAHFSKKQHKCKSCQKEYMIEYRKNNKEKLLEYGREYYENNKELFAVKAKIYYDHKNHSKLNKNSKINNKKYRENNRDTINERSRIFYKNNKEEIKIYTLQLSKKK